VKIWKVVIAVMLIFGAGVVTGGLLVRTRVAQVAPAAAPSVMGTPASAPVPVSPARQAFVQKVRHELNLTPEQSAQVDDIMRESRKRTAKIYEPVMPEAHEETRRVRQEIQAILTPEQKKKFNEVFKRRQRENAEEHKNLKRAETNAADIQPR
jgi:Spy/CpxP family protein refolding chaperone